MARIDYYFSVLSPFTYLAGLGLEEIAARHGAEIAYKPADIMKVFGETGGVPPAKRHPSRQAYRLQELKRISARRGLKLNLKPAHWPTDQLPASKAIIAVAESGGDVGALAHAVLRAVWAEERDIGDPAPPWPQSWPRTATTRRPWPRRWKPPRRHIRRTPTMRSPPACSARRPTWSVTRCSGARTGWTIWTSI